MLSKGGTRGRSSSRFLNRVLLSLVPEILACNFSLLLLWFRSAFNPSDDGARGREIRAAEVAPDCVGDSVRQASDRWKWVAPAHPKTVLSEIADPVFLHFFCGPCDPLGSAVAAAGWKVVAFDDAFEASSRAVPLSPEDARNDPNVIIRLFGQLGSVGNPIGPNCPDATWSSTFFL